MNRDDELDALLRVIAANPARLDDVDVQRADIQRAVARLYGRLDTLELLREVVREEQLLRLFHVRTGTGSGTASDTRRGREPGVVSIPSPGSSSRSRALRSASGARWRTISLAAAAVLVVGVALNWSAVSMVLQSIGVGSVAMPRTIITRVAELDTVNLPDGSRAIMAPNSSLHYTIAPRRGPRELRLEGEAYFDVKHDDERPFRVQTRHAVVEDLGTTFVVREYAGDGRARVAVRSGTAALRARDGSRSSPTSLRSGEGAYVDSSGGIARFSGDPESYGSWTSGRLEFDAARLPEVLSELARWYDVEFQITDSTLDRQYFTGAFSSTSLSKALAILGPVVHARFEQQGRVVVVTPRPEGR